MATKLEIQSSFTSGEITPRLYGQVGVSKYASGLATATNVRILPQGSVIRRNGSEFIAEVANSANPVRLIKFQFDQTNAYIIELGNQYMRFYKGGGQIQSGGSPYQITTPFLSAELFEVTYVVFANTMFLAHFNHPPQQLVWNGDTSWVLTTMVFQPPALQEFGLYPLSMVTPGAVSGNGVTFTAGTNSGGYPNFLAADVGREIVHCSATGQPDGGGTATIVSITDANNAVANISTAFINTSAIPQGQWLLDSSPIAAVTPNLSTDGSIAVMDALIIGSGGSIDPQTTMTPSAASGSAINCTAASGCFTAANVGGYVASLIDPGKARITAFTSATIVVASTTTAFTNTTSSAFTNVNAYPETNWAILTPVNTWRASDIGRYMFLDNGYIQITGWNTADQIYGQIISPLNSVTSSEVWQLMDPSWSATNGYPRIVCMHQQRLCFASTLNNPQTVWMSESGNFNNLGAGANDGDPISINISSNEVNQVQWMQAINTDLAVGTFGAEISLNNGAGSGPITPTTAMAQTRSYYGSNIQQVIAIGNELLYVQKSNRKISSFRYNYLINNYESEDLTFLAEHITAGVVKEIAYAHDPDRNIYAVLNDGTMAVGTYYHEQQVMAWTRFTTNGAYESVSVISTGEYDEVWVVVNRNINGSQIRFVEVFDTSAGTTSYTNTDGYADCYLTYNKPIPITTITNTNPCVVTAPGHGLSNGQTIKIIGTTGLTEVNNLTYAVANATTNTFVLALTGGGDVDSTLMSTYISGGNVHLLVTSVSNLSQLNGMTVQIVGDGAVQNTKVVSGGSVTLDRPCYQVMVGLEYDSTITTLRKEFNLGQGTEQGQAVRWIRPVIRVYNSVIPVLNGKYQPARSPLDHMDAAVPLYTGDIIYHGFEWDQTNGQLTIVISAPLPFMLSGIFGSIEGGQQ